MRSGIIYIITNSINDKVYIGQTLIDINTRFRQHKEKVKQGRDSKIYSAMRELGVENFNIKELENNIPENELDSKERYYIEKYDSINNGYNTTVGGDGRSKSSSLDEAKIIEMVQNNVTTLEIAKYFNVSSATIQRLLISKGIRRYDKIDDNLLKELWKDNTIKNLAEYFGVNEKTIRRHAKKLNLSKRK